MADIRIPSSDLSPVFGPKGAFMSYLTGNELFLQAIYLPGSISLSKVLMLYSASGTTAKTATFEVGIYSLNGATLSLWNTASVTVNPTANTTEWVSMGVSTVSDITPGNWWIAHRVITGGNSRVHPWGFLIPSDFGNSYPGLAYMGEVDLATNAAMPGSIATNDVTKTGNENSTHRWPMIILSS